LSLARKVISLGRQVFGLACKWFSLARKGLKFAPNTFLLARKDGWAGRKPKRLAGRDICFACRAFCLDCRLHRWLGRVKGAEAALGSDVMNALMDGDALLKLLGPRREMAGRFSRSVSGTEGAAPDK
jgi:hypothetical protein